MRKLSVILLIVFSALMLTSCAFLMTGGAATYTEAEKNTAYAFTSAKYGAEALEDFVKTVASAGTSSYATIDNSGWFTTHSKEKKALQDKISSMILSRGDTIISFTSGNGFYSYTGGMSEISFTCTFKYQTAGSSTLLDGSFSIAGTVVRDGSSFVSYDVVINGVSYDDISYGYSPSSFTRAEVGGRTVNVYLLNEIARP